MMADKGMNKTDCMQFSYSVGELGMNKSEINIRLLTLQIEEKLCLLSVYTKQAEDGTWY